MKFSIKDFFSKSDQIGRKLRIWSHLMEKSLTENLIFCAVVTSLSLTCKITTLCQFLIHQGKEKLFLITTLCKKWPYSELFWPYSVRMNIRVTIRVALFLSICNESVKDLWEFPLAKNLTVSIECFQKIFRDLKIFF